VAAWLGVLFGPAVGFLLGFAPAAFVSGLVMARLRDLPVFAAALVAAITGGILAE
jgi:biotin transport system substrate-specific component